MRCSICFSCAFCASTVVRALVAGAVIGVGGGLVSLADVPLQPANPNTATALAIVRYRRIPTSSARAATKLNGDPKLPAISPEQPRSPGHSDPDACPTSRG